MGIHRFPEGGREAPRNRAWNAFFERLLEPWKTPIFTMQTSILTTGFPKNPPAGSSQILTPWQGGNQHPLFGGACGAYILCRKATPAGLAHSLTGSPKSDDLVMVFEPPFYEKSTIGPWSTTLLDSIGIT